ncbi:MAG: hypothetical protein IJS57_07095 [Paludibacteraceae bacterium]|nr:hypothetical protein [Paludibacteraceae bacterium]
MKKYLFVAILAVASIAAYAQPRAIGANLGANFGFSYQHGFGEANMLDVAVYSPWASGFIPGYGIQWGLGATITYDWIDPFGATVPWNEKGEWHWYMGVGGDGGFFFPPAGAPQGYLGGWVGAAGHFGIEYDFWFPLQLSLDWRPSIGVGLAGANGQVQAQYNTGGLYQGISLGVRYKF